MQQQQKQQKQIVYILNPLNNDNDNDTILSIAQLQQQINLSSLPGKDIPTIVSESDFLTQPNDNDKDDDGKLKFIMLDTSRIKEKEDDEKEQHSNNNKFSLSRFSRCINTKEFGSLVLYSPIITSTSDVMMDYCTGFEQGLVFVADLQTKGRGRGNNEWFSPQGCLTFSFKTCTSDGVTLPFLQYLVSLAVIKSIKDDPLYSTINIKIKWPNDIYANGKKIGGILCQSNYFNGYFDVVIGIGLNVWNCEPTTCINQLIREKGLEELSREQILARFLEKMEEMYPVFLREGFQPFMEGYLSNWLHSGQRVKLFEDKQRDVMREVFIEGIADNGSLLARDENGNEYELVPDTNSFDIENLVIHKKK